MTILFNKEIYLDLEKRDKSPGRVSDFGMSSTILERETNWKAFATLSDFWQLLACFHLLAAWGDMFAANIGGPNFEVVFSCPTPPHWATVPKFWPKPIPRPFSDTKFSKTDAFLPRPNSPKPRPNFPKPKTRLFSPDQILQNWYRNSAKIGKSLETETKTGTSQYPWQFLERSSPNSFLLFLRNVAVFAFLHVCNR